LKKDFEFICDLMIDFVKQAHIQNTFIVIDKQCITGWETWFQVEFATFLSKHIDVGSWEREQPYQVDGRKKMDKNNAIVDFKVRKKRTKIDRMITLEFKQNSSRGSCITNMIYDLQKIEAIKSSSSQDMRSYWAIGVHPRHDTCHASADKEHIKNDILKKSKKFSFGLIEECIVTRYIPNTNLAYTIF